MCILLKLDYAEFGVCNLSFSKVIEEKFFWGKSDRFPLGKGRVKRGSIKIQHKIFIGSSHHSSVAMFSHLARTGKFSFRQP